MRTEKVNAIKQSIRQDFESGDVVSVTNLQRIHLASYHEALSAVEIMESDGFIERNMAVPWQFVKTSKDDEQ